MEQNGNENTETVQYEHDREGNELYPIKVKRLATVNVLKGQLLCTYETMYDNKYALNKDGTFYYPLDCHGNEYYRSWTDPSLKEEDIIHHRYAISNKGFYIVPKKNDSEYISERISPLIRMNETPFEPIDRGFDNLQDYLTIIQSGIQPRKLRFSDDNDLDDSPESPTQRDDSHESATQKTDSHALPFYQSWTFWIVLLSVIVKVCVVVFLFWNKTISTETLLNSLLRKSSK